MKYVYSQTVLSPSERQFERFNELMGLAKMLQETCEEGEKIYAGFTHLLGDIWYAFYTCESQLQSNMQKHLPIQYDVVEHLMQTEEFIKWQQLTVADDLLAVLTTVSVGEQLKTWFKDNRAVRDAQWKRERAERMEQRVHDRIKELQVLQGDSSASVQEKRRIQLQIEWNEKQLVASQQEKQQALKELQNTMQDLSKGQLSLMLAHSQKEVRETKQTVAEIGALCGKKLNTVPITEQFQLAEEIRQQDVLQKIAELVGRFKRIAKKKQKIKHKMTMERQNITLGQEVGRLLPMELAHFIMPHAKLDFLRRYAEQQTLVFDTQGKERKGRGPIIICIDESSSMTSIKAESKAFCLALLAIARKQKRDLAIVPFASDVGEMMVFPKGRSTVDEVLAFNRRFLGGGTNYEKPLRASLDILTTSEFNHADILFVTDGSSFLPSRFLEEFNVIKQKRKFECIAVILTNLINTVDVELVKRFSDKVIEVNTLLDAEEAFSIGG
ncbi:VWA domain-containing protein [Lysinibacillus sp. KU-BSD001]|uniref:vWA domain-containing protein n=1 Tax=Lysinibacillus sp. KU-BSD001 TaxID=3141328 RepID=UPI0036E4CD64